MRAVPFDDELLMIFSPDLSCTYWLATLLTTAHKTRERVLYSRHDGKGVWTISNLLFVWITRQTLPGHRRTLLDIAAGQR